MIQTFILEIITNQNFGQRNFGLLCDQSLMDQTVYHQIQKYGQRVRKIKLEPLKQHYNSLRTQHIRNNIAHNINNSHKIKINNQVKFQRQPSIEDQRHFIKKISHKDNQGFVLLFNSFTITEHNTIDQKPNFKQFKLHLPLSVSKHLLSLNTISELLKKLQENLENVDSNQIRFDYQAALDIEIDKKSPTELPDQLFIENRYGDGYYLVVFPKVEIYLPQFAYHQKIFLKAHQAIQIIEQNFDNHQDYVSKFDNAKFEEFWKNKKKQKQDNNGVQLFDIRKNKKIDKIKEDKKKQEKKNQSQESQPSLQTDQSLNRLKVPSQDHKRRRSSLLEQKKELYNIVVQDSYKQLEDWQTKKILNQVAYCNEKPYLVVFQPSRVILREKHQQKIVRKCYPTFAQYNGLIGYCLNHDMQYFLSNLVKASGYINDDFKEVIELAVEWPIGGDEAIEIGQKLIDDGILEEHKIEVVLNNRHYEIELSQPSLCMYEQSTNEMYKKSINSEIINEITKRNYNCIFVLV